VNAAEVILKPDAFLLLECPCCNYSYETPLVNWRMDDFGEIIGFSGDDSNFCPKCQSQPHMVGVRIGEEIL
jgi:hypothetical protein